MFFFYSLKNKLNRVPGGKKIPLNCGLCKQKSTFYECTVDDNFSIYHFLELWKRTKRVMQCGECLAVSDYYEVFPLEKAQEERAAAATKVKELEESARKNMEAEKERQRQQDLAQKKRAEEQRLKQIEVDNDLKELKKKLGK